MTQFQLLSWIAAAVVVIFLYIWGVFNSMVRKQNQVRTDYSDIDIQLKRRSSLIQNLADLVRSYAKHEKETFENVTKARSAVDTSASVHDSAKAENMLTQTLRSLFMVVEQYPQLQASQNYKTLRDDLTQTENAIAMYREDYNRSVQDFNNYILTFPRLLVAPIFKFKQADLFQASEISPAPTV